MPEFLHETEINKILLDYPEYAKINIFVESGTNVGRTIFHLAPIFKELHTIEIAKPLYDLCLNRAQKENINNIHFYFGDTLDVLPRIIEKINAPTLFWLDGHYCKGNTGRGKIDPPMREELNLIFQEHNQNSIIMIDNVDVFGRKGPPGEEDWTHINIEYIMQGQKTDNIVKYYIENDRLIFLLKKL